MKRAFWKKITEFAGPEESPGFLLWQVSTRWRRLLESALSEIGLTHPQFVLLASVGWLTRAGSRVSQIDLARHSRLDVTMTSQVLRTLEKKGYIARELKEGNERSKFPVVTESGAKLIEKAIPLVEAIDRQFFEVLGEEIPLCIEVFRKLASK